MSVSSKVRTAHRWIAIAFTLGVIANLFVREQNPYPAWAGFSALAPLVLLLLSGLYLFALPYASRWRSRQRAT